MVKKVNNNDIKLQKYSLALISNYRIIIKIALIYYFSLLIKPKHNALASFKTNTKYSFNCTTF